MALGRQLGSWRKFLESWGREYLRRDRDEEELAACRAHTSLPRHTNPAAILPTLRPRASITGLIDYLIPLPVRPHVRASVQHPPK